MPIILRSLRIVATPCVLNSAASWLFRIYQNAPSLRPRSHLLNTACSPSPAEEVCVCMYLFTHVLIHTCIFIGPCIHWPMYRENMHSWTNVFMNKCIHECMFCPQMCSSTIVVINKCIHWPMHSWKHVFTNKCVHEQIYLLMYVLVHIYSVNVSFIFVLIHMC